MGDSINQIFMKILGINLIVIGVVAMGSPLLSIYIKKHEKTKTKGVYLYLVGGIIAICVGIYLFRTY